MCGNWIYSGMWTEAGSQIQRRVQRIRSGMGVYPNWAWSWPAKPRVLYNRLLATPRKPWEPGSQNRYVERIGGKWVGTHVPDFKPAQPKDHMGPI